MEIFWMAIVRGGSYAGKEFPGWELSCVGIFRVGVTLVEIFWVGIVPVGIFRMRIAQVQIILGGNSPKWEFSRWEFFGGNQPSGNFPGGSSTSTKNSAIVLASFFFKFEDLKLYKLN